MHKVYTVLHRPRTLSLDIQHKIVQELEGEQEIINANRKLIVKMGEKIKAKLDEFWMQ